MFYHTSGTEKKTVELNIPRNQVNEFLSLLWDQFNLSIGKVSAQHNYSETSDPELFEYTVRWASSSLPFIAELCFYNHTSKGLLSVVVGAVDFDTKLVDATSRDLIVKAIKAATKLQLQAQPLGPSAYLKFGILSRQRLSGDYNFPLSKLILLASESVPDVSGHVIIPLYSANPQEQYHEGSRQAIAMASALSTLTQQHITVADEAYWNFLNPKLFQEVSQSTTTSGQFINDVGLFRKGPTNGGLIDPLTLNEIISAEDCIEGGLLCLPQYTDSLLMLIGDNEFIQQSCNRFSEALQLRAGSDRGVNNIYLVGYELIAYVSAIEALLDISTRKVDIVCQSCGDTMLKEEWKVSEKFRSFVDEHTQNNPVLRKVFKMLYEDRSKFVHTGHSLHHFDALRAHRPLLLEGKKFVNNVPHYYFNIHDFTGYLLRRYLYSQIAHVSPTEGGT